MHIQRQEHESAIRNVALPTAIGVVLFLMFSGASIIGPEHLDWIFTSEGDPTQHFIGWNFFRHSPAWQIPPGMNTAYGEALGSSIVFSDSLPLFAFVFKALRNFLPANFQYFGLWLGLCFVLQANFAWRIAARYTMSTGLRALSCALITLTPAMLIRLGGHEALCGQWLLLAALLFYLREPRSASAWLILLPVSALIHAYLFAMVSALWAASFVQCYFREGGSSRAAAAEAASMAALVLATLWLAGYFVAGSVSAWGYGYYRLNILGPFSPGPVWSMFFTAPLLNGDYEGFSYLGAGVFLLALAAAALTARHRRTLPLNTRRIMPLLVLCVLFYLYALSNHVAFGAHELFHFKTPPALNKLFTAFRATGRFVWPVIYAFEVLLLCCVLKLASRKLAFGILIVCVLVQVADLTKAFAYYRDRWSHDWRPVLVSAFWDQVPRQYKRIAFVMPLEGDKKYGPPAWLASKNGMTINGGYLARVDGQRLDEVQQKLVQTVRSGDFRSDTLYVFFNSEYWNEARAHFKGDGAVGVVDTYRVIAPGWQGCTSTCGMHDDDTDLQMQALPDDAPYLRSGWSISESDGRWTNGSTAQISFPMPRLDDPDTMRVTLDFVAFLNPRHPHQRVEIAANGHAVAQWTIDSPDRQVRTFDIPHADLASAGKSLIIDFTLPDATSPKALSLGEDPRQLGIKLRTVKLEAR